MIVLLQEYIANTNYQSVVVNTLDEPIIARYVIFEFIQLLGMDTHL